MLLEHDNLEEFQDPANYDREEAENKQPSNAFYRVLALQTGGPVLELACGTGLTIIPLASAGLAATGVDLTAAMVAYARHKSYGLPVDWVVDDMRTVRLGRRYRFSLLTGNAF